jgi:hypothetical protein
LPQDLTERFGHPVWLLETFVDPRYFHCTIYRTASWEYVGETRGFRRTRSGYSDTAQTPKWVFVRPSVARALQDWNVQYGDAGEGLAIDGKTMCNAIDEQDRQIHILGAVGHQTRTCHTEKKLPACP